MRYNIISYLIGEGFRNAFKNKKSTMISITTMFLTMIMFGAFFILGENINHIVTNIEKQQGMQVFLKKDATDEEMKKVGEEILKIEGVNTAKFISKDDAFNDIKEQWKNYEYLMDSFPQEMVSASYTVTLTDLSMNETVQTKIIELGDIVNEISATNKTISTLESIAKGLRIGILVILVALIIISVFIISNTIKLSVHARRKEISIMKYVGATNGFIRWPFIVEGIIIGVIAALITIIVVGAIYNAIAVKAVQSEVLQTLNISLVSFTDMINLIMIMYLTIGVGIGVLGSSMSMRKYLEV